MCEFQSLYYDDDGYVVHCRDCGCYQLAYGNTMLSLDAAAYEALCLAVKKKYRNVDFSASGNTRNIVIPAPAKGLYLLLTRQEAFRLQEILEEADTERMTQSLLALFRD